MHSDCKFVNVTNVTISGTSHCLIFNFSFLTFSYLSVKSMNIFNVDVSDILGFDGITVLSGSVIFPGVHVQEIRYGIANHSH